MLASADVTANPAMSDMMGLNADRLYMNLRTSAMLAIMQSENLLFSVDAHGITGLFSMVDSMCQAIAVEVVSEIQSHSNLMAMTRDAGIAGAGIITGWVK